MIPFIYYLTNEADRPALSQDLDVFNNLIDLGLSGAPLRALLRDNRAEFVNAYTGEELTVELCRPGTFIVHTERNA